MIPDPHAFGAEAVIVLLVLWLKLFVEAIGALLIGIGVVLAGLRFLRSALPPTTADFLEVRLTLARFLALGLEFQLGADILSTAVAPSWDQIGKLGAIAVIRTALNFFLAREAREMQEDREGRAQAH